MVKWYRLTAFGVILLGVLLPGGLRAQSPEEKGLAIATEADRRDTGFGNSVAELEMILRNREGRESYRSLKIKTFEMIAPDVGDKSLVIFDSPRDIKGTAFLTHSKIRESDDQWIYLPMLGKVKRISSSSKAGSFMGSEFSYEDMSSRDLGKYKYKWLRTEACGTLTCFVVESYPLDEKSGYTKLVSWIDTVEYRTWKTDFYNRRGDLFKVLSQSDYKKYLDKFWRATKLFMENKVTGKTTELRWSRFDFRTDLTENDFSKGRIKTAR
ncbi:outer membrane lipoprotein-sorting protein [Paremcibacter congregatus]|uniref:Outer membrane lipoprotein-sorting protein n=1 Tax=Paremcibacter congregatus TaxID=2043170 RepID=A0A2G4YUG6_9PROT|nr:outer membrane lipoprotein-sorting protein [Paremcibacter congregatus]PHZ85988.1 outer membrane lipoprotein-sorting protein [Paremcibacter congregatus]QDE26954.1 outer membrane lipoprotein-sorting protein [Paremcibacter congregatus]